MNCLGRTRTSATCHVSVGESTTERALTGTAPEIAAQLAEIGQPLNDTPKANPIAAAGVNLRDVLRACSMFPYESRTGSVPTPASKWTATSG
jgi:hypothetical protein